MTEEISLESYKKAYREIRMEEEKRGFLIHLVVYLFVNAMMIVINFLFAGLLLPTAAAGCPLFVNDNAEFLTEIQVTPLNVNIDYLSDEHHQAMPVFSVASNQPYSLKIDFDLKDASKAVFLKVLRCGNDSFPELYRIALPPDQLIAGRNSVVVNLPAPEETGMNEASLYMIRTVGVAGHIETPNWNAIFTDGPFAGRAPEELNWDNFEVAYQVTAKVGGESHNPFIKDLSLTPDKTTLASGEGFSVGARYYRTYWCPSDYFKFLAKNEQTGEVVELGRWAAPYWEMVKTGWQTFSKNLTAPSEPGTYIVKAVGCSGHGTNTYFGVNWNDPRSDGGFRGHRPEELSWDFYEIAAEFKITVTEEWSFLVITDLHIGRNYLDYDGEGYSDRGTGEDYYLTERLRKAVSWVNENHRAKHIKFVAVLGDLSENGQRSEMRKAKEILDGLEIPYFPVIGNHDVWSRYNYVKDPHTGEIKRSDPVAEGDRYFKEIFNEEFYRQQFEKLGVTEWDFDNASRFHNYAFVYKRVKFIGLDFVRRDTDSPSGGKVYENSKEWLEKHLYDKNTRAILWSHHPMFKDVWKGCENVIPIEAILKRASEDLGTRALANFAGHVHSTYDEYLKIHYPVYYKDAEINKDWSEDESTPLGIPVVTTEALMAASNMDGPKGCLRLVKVGNSEDIDFHLIYGGYDFRVLNPYFRKITWRPFLFTLGWNVRFELFAFNKIYEQKYSLNFGDGSKAQWYDIPSLLRWRAHRYPARGGTYTTEFTLSKDDINVAETITRTITLPRLKLAIAAHSPVDVILTDPDGLTTTKQVYGIPGSYYYEDDFDEDGDSDDVVTLSELKMGDYLISLLPQPEANPTDTYTLEVLGEDTIVSFAYNVQAAHIPAQPYVVRVTETGIIPIIPATVDFDPDTLNLKSQGKYVTTYIELPVGHGYDPSMISPGTVTLNGQIKSEAKPVEIGNYDADGIPDLMVKFNRAEVQKILQAGEKVRITVTGSLTDGRLFEGTDFIRVKP